MSETVVHDGVLSEEGARELLEWMRFLACPLARRMGGVVEVGDLVGIGMEQAVLAARTWREDGGASFRAWVERRARGAMVDYVRKEVTHGITWSPKSRRECMVRIEGMEEAERIGVDGMAERLHWKLLAERVMDRMTRRQRQVAQRMLLGDRQSEAAAALGVTKAAAFQALALARKRPGVRRYAGEMKG